MRCDEFEARLNDLLDLRLDPTLDLPLAEHGEHCSACRQLLAGYSEFLLGWEPLAIPAPSHRFSERVVEGWLADYPLAPRRRHLPRLIATAAVILIALYLRSRGGLMDERSAQNAAVAALESQQQSPAIAAQAEVSSLTVDQSPYAIPDASSTVVSDSQQVDVITASAIAGSWSDLAHDPDGLLADVASLWPAPLRPAAVSAQSSMHAKPVAIAEVATGLKPLTDSAAGAMHFLLNVLPSSASTLAAPLEPLPDSASAKLPNEAS